jgi:hypothetical protein
MTTVIEERGVVLALAVKREIPSVIGVVVLEITGSPVGGGGAADDSSARHRRDSGQKEGGGGKDVEHDELFTGNDGWGQRECGLLKEGRQRRK